MQALEVSNKVRVQKMMTGQTDQSNNIRPTSTPKPGDDKLEHTPEPRSTGLNKLPNPAYQRDAARGYLQDKQVMSRQRVDQAAGYKDANLYKDRDGNPLCFKCGEMGHLMRDCDKSPNLHKVQAKMVELLFHQGSPGETQEFQTNKMEQSIPAETNWANVQPGNQAARYRRDNATGNVPKRPEVTGNFSVLENTDRYFQKVRQGHSPPFHMSLNWKDQFRDAVNAFHLRMNSQKEMKMDKNVFDVMYVAAEECRVRGDDEAIDDAYKLWILSYLHPTNDTFNQVCQLDTTDDSLRGQGNP